MNRLAASLAPIVVVLSCAFAGGTLAQEGKSGEPKKVRLTPKEFQGEIAVHDGDKVELWLPSSMPYGWVLDEGKSHLKLEKLGPAELREIEMLQQGGGADGPVGKAGRFAGRYKVEAKGESTTVVKWMYCKYGKLAETRKELDSGQIPKPPEFRSDMKAEELKPGTVFQATIKTRPR